jgi:hypothetical protein
MNAKMARILSHMRMICENSITRSPESWLFLLVATELRSIPDRLRFGRKRKRSHPQKTAVYLHFSAELRRDDGERRTIASAKKETAASNGRRKIHRNRTVKTVNWIIFAVEIRRLGAAKRTGRAYPSASKAGA